MNTMMKAPPEFESGSAAEPSAGAARRAADALDEAALWLSRLDSGTADPEAFERWRAADPARAIACARVAAAWSALDDTPAVLAAPPHKALSRRAALMSFGGLALAVVGVGVSGKVLAREQAKTGVGERRTIRLGPGARVDLNTDSHVFWRAGPDLVTLWLERGEIAVSAAAGAATVHVRGEGVEWRLAPGRYNARLDDDRLELTTLDGMAESRRPRPVRLTPGKRLILRDGVVSTGEAPGSALARATAWPQGEIVFEDAPLEEAVAEYNRYLERKLTIADPQIAHLRIGGRFTSSDPSDFLAALQAVLPVRAQSSGAGVVLTHAG
ncbi:MAG: iron dicitrate transport regulator FecR [Alphaproteobacteria bacterium]|nr:MAG: iron dicitrate transport regulator FecR [Alphaproteobacteria bacterium]